jgi:hypothetical protein
MLKKDVLLQVFEQKMQNQMTNGQFILYRTNAQSRSMEDACVKEISHTVFMEDCLLSKK